LLCVPPPSLPIFRRGRVLFGVVTIATSIAATVSVSLLPPPYSVLLLCTTDGRRRCSVALSLFRLLLLFDGAPLPRPSSSHSRLPLPPRSHLFLPP
jgi:hypothetical protein